MSVLGPDSPLFKKEPSKRGQWLAHHPMLIPWTILVISPLQKIIHDSGETGEWVAFVLNQLIVALILWVAWVSTKHLRGFCEYCFHQPAGGPAVAQRHMRQLRLHHLKTDTNRWLALGFLVVVYSPVVFLSGWPWVGYSIVFFFLFGFLDKVSQTHDWLVPWCPWCKDDGRWTEPSPTPDPSMTKQRV